MRRLAPLLLSLLIAAAASAQDRPPPTSGPPGARPLPSDTLGAPRDTVATPIVLPVPRAPAAEGGLDRAVRYTARDSLRIRLAARDSAGAEGDVVSLFGEVRTEYEGAQITAGRVDYESGAELLRASAVASDSGEVGRPSYSGEEGEFSGRTFVYNLRTRRGRVTGARTAIDDGYLLGGILKQADERVVFAQDAAYTTCELDHPHYSVVADRMKVVDGEEVFTGPVQLRLLGIPMPVLLPFGYFPAAEGRRSGPLPVRYGQDTSYGLFLDNVGWYWALSDYLDAQLTGRVGTQGSFQLTGQTRYTRRYAYSGSMTLQYGRIRTGEPTDPGYAPRTPVGVRWSHNQTFPAGQRLTASVNLQSVSQRLASDDLDDQTRTSTSSSVQYSQQWPSAGRSLTVSAQAFQNFATNQTTATLPQLSFSQQRRFPFRRGRDDRWYEKLSLSYTATLQNAFAYAPRDTSIATSALDALFSERAFREAVCPPGEDPALCDESRFDYQVTQVVPVSASFSVPRFNLSLGPTLNYSETWADGETVQTYDAEADEVVTRRRPGFTPFRRVQLSASASSELYGTFPVRVGALDGIRHTVTPQVSLTYEPDYEAFGFVREVQVDSTGRTRRYTIDPSIPVDPSRSLSVSVQNAFVARTVRTDSTGEQTRTTRQVLSLGLTGGYNFAAEGTPIQPVNARFSTEVYGFRASGNAAFSAYALDSLGLGTPLTYLDVTGRPLRLTSLNLQVNRSVSGGRGSRRPDVRAVLPTPGLGEPYDPTVFGPRLTPVGYVDYAAPWSASFALTLGRSQFGLGPAQTVATLNVSQINARLTRNWSLTGRTGLDLTSLELTPTQIGLRRDLHCWELAINWQPIGVTRLFAVSLYVKSGFLRDFLRLDVPNSRVRSPSFSPGGGFGGGF